MFCAICTTLFCANGFMFYALFAPISSNMCTNREVLLVQSLKKFQCTHDSIIIFNMGVCVCLCVSIHGMECG